jgi:hypothetical protein
MDDDDWWEDEENDEHDTDDDRDDSSCDGSSVDKEGVDFLSDPLARHPPPPLGAAAAVEYGNNPYEGKRFCNRGLETWCRARAAWVSECSGKALRKSPPVPASFRKELIKCLADKRQFELSQRIALRCVISAYQQVWKDGDND